MNALGIETAEQGAGLRALGCDIGQGSHYARPLEPDALLAWAGAADRRVATAA